MSQKQRKPGDQAPPPRPPHRNNTRTATTHVTTTDGRYYVHDGNGETVVINGQRAENLTRDEARKAKDIAVTKLKMRQAGIRQHVEDEPFTEADAVGEEPAAVPDSFVPASAPPHPDPAIRRNQQAAANAARPIAQAAQKRADQAKAKPTAKPVQRAPGWEQPHAGATKARQAPAPKPDQKAAGWEQPSGGKKSAAPEIGEPVSTDPIEGDGSLELEQTDEVADILGGGGDLETEVKRKVEETENKVIEACKTLAIGDAVLYYPDDSGDSITAAVVQVHAPTCIALQLPADNEQVMFDATQVDAGKHVHPKMITVLTGQVMKSVMLAPKEGNRGGTWTPIL
jgi:hypothetical protein